MFLEYSWVLQEGKSWNTLLTLRALLLQQPSVVVVLQLMMENNTEASSLVELSLNQITSGVRANHHGLRFLSKNSAFYLLINRQQNLNPQHGVSCFLFVCLLVSFIPGTD